MLKTLLTIGCAADAELLRHATRLAIRGNDSAGSGSATEVDDEELTEEERANRDAAEGNDDLDGDLDEGSRRSAKQQKAYDEVKSDRDKLKNDLEAQRRENQEFKERLAKIEGERTSRQETNDRTNASMERAEKRARETAERVAKISADDPERTVKIYTELYKPFYEDLPKEAEEISRRTAKETFQLERQLDQTQDSAKQETIKALEAVGLDEDWYEEVEDLAVRKQRKDPGWFKRVPVEEQIDVLVDEVKQRFNPKPKRDSQEFQDERDAHRRPMRGVIDRGSQRRSVRDTDDGADDGAPKPGAFLAEMARAAKARRQSTNVMLRQSESNR